MPIVLKMLKRLDAWLAQLPSLWYGIGLFSMMAACMLIRGDDSVLFLFIGWLTVCAMIGRERGMRRRRQQQ